MICNLCVCLEDSMLLYSFLHNLVWVGRFWFYFEITCYMRPFLQCTKQGCTFMLNKSTTVGSATTSRRPTEKIRHFINLYLQANYFRCFKEYINPDSICNQYVFHGLCGIERSSSYVIFYMYIRR